MVEDVLFEPSVSNTVNLNSLASDMLVLQERRILEICEIAANFVDLVRELGDDEMSLCEIFSLLSGNELLPLHSPDDDSVMPSNLPRINSYLKLLSASDRAVFVSFVRERFLQTGIGISENDFLATAKSDHTFVYVKNAFSDEAYDVFSQEFSNPRVSYLNSFKDTLVAVSDGRVSYCLLPIEERGARISTVDEMIFKFDLKVVSITPVWGFDGLADMKYALVSRHFAESAIAADDDRYFEFRLPKDFSERLGDILSAAESFRFEIYSLNTVRFDTDDGERDYFSIVLRSSGTDFVEMLIYLTLFADEFNAVGLYKNIE